MDDKKVHIGVIGHIDHSKTTLTYAISLVKEKESINEVKEYDASKLRFDEYIPKEEKPKVKKKRYK